MKLFYSKIEAFVIIALILFILFAFFVVAFLPHVFAGCVCVPSGGGGGPLIFYDFSTNLITNIRNIVTVTGGHGTNNTGYDYCYGYYNASNTGSNDHYVQAQVNTVAGDTDNGGGVVLRSNMTTGYEVHIFDTSNFVLSSFSGVTRTGITAGIAFASTPFTFGNTYWIRVQVSGTSFNFWYWNGSSWVASTSNPLTDTTYSTGTYVGASAGGNCNANTACVDNMSADTNSANLPTPGAQTCP